MVDQRDPGDQRHQEEGSLLMVQIDHLPGDLLSEVLARLCSSGAMNVQLLPTLTKKGRPGQLLLVDVPRDRLTSIERILLSEVGVTGWHMIPTQHVFFRTELLDYEVTVIGPERVLQCRVSGKRLADPGSTVVPEHSSCLELRERLRSECGLEVPLREVVRLVSDVMNDGGDLSIDLTGHNGGKGRSEEVAGETPRHVSDTH